MDDRLVYSTEDVLVMLDELLTDEGGARWDRFYADRSRPCPFLVEWPDENLAAWFAADRLRPGRVLELGCGHGRNALYLASRGCQVDAVDMSAQAIAWARERTDAAGLTVSFQCRSLFDAAVPEQTYDFVYDSGCFHHLPPHRRKDYVELVIRALKPGGGYGLVCFRPEGGSGLSDREVYERQTLGGGLGYCTESLTSLWAERLEIKEFRQMEDTPEHAGLFGESFLWVLLAANPT